MLNLAVVYEHLDAAGTVNERVNNFVRGMDLFLRFYESYYAEGQVGATLDTFIDSVNEYISRIKIHQDRGLGNGEEILEQMRESVLKGMAQIVEVSAYRSEREELYKSLFSDRQDFD